MNNHEAVMGEGLREFGESRTVHTIFNDLFGKPSRVAFSQRAVILQQKKIPDESFYQGIINWDMMRSKTDATIIRAGQNLWIDSQFKINWVEAGKRNMYRGSYWFYDDRVSPRAQADIWISLLKADKPEMEIWVDWERSYGGAYSGLARVCEMMQYMEAAGFKVGLYTGYFWFRGNSNSVNNAAQYNYLKTHLLWEAWYTSNASIVLVPAPFTFIYLWQFGTPSSAGWGVQSLEIDMSYINLTDAQFYDKYGGVTTPPPPNGGTMYEGTIKSTVSGNPISQVNVRPKPYVPPSGDASNNPVGQLSAGTAVKADALVTDTLAPPRQWLHLTSPIAGYVSAAYVDYHEVQPPVSGAPLKSVVTMPDGTRWEATQFTKL